MSTMPSSRKDVFGTEGIGEDGDADMGTAGHSTQGGTARNADRAGETPPRPSPTTGNPANSQALHGGELGRNAQLEEK